MLNYLKRKMALLSLSLSRVEKSMLTQKSDALGDIGSMEQTYHQGMLADALLRGEITMPVKELRWRLYKVLSESKNKTAKITGYDSDGLPIVETYTIEKYKLDKIKCDNFDPYPVELVVNNDDIMKSTTEALSNEKLQLYSDEESKSERADRFNLVGTESWSNRSLGEISFDDMVASIKSKKTIFVARNTKPKFEIEYYAKKLLVRRISETEKLLEFYISSYPDEYDKKTKFLISEIKKAIKNPRASDLFDINKVGFISEKTIGTNDGLEYEYEIKKIDKIIEFNGHYVIKFICEVTINGDNIFEKYKLEELEKRYENKEAKK
jgi:hypothetical protein